MTEFLYDLDKQRTGRAPVIKKLGAIKIGMEQTPVCYKGKYYMAESCFFDNTTNRGGQYLRVRDLDTGEVSEGFGEGCYFASAFVDGDLFCVFVTTPRDDGPLTFGLKDVPESEWHDPRGGHEVRMYYSTDIKHWDYKDIIVAPDRRMWNTSVCKAGDKYVMAIEVSTEDGHGEVPVGVGFTCFFAESDDLMNWKRLPDECHYTDKRYNACPVLRYYDEWYYMICLEYLPCGRYAPYIYRTKNFLDWFVGFHNPMMMWSDEDRVPHKDSHLTPEELDILENRLNINCSDLDLIERDGKTHIYYANGDQLTYSFLCEAVYDGSEQQFLEHFFR